MSANPLIAFFKQSMLPAGSQVNTLPIAFTRDGEMFDPVKETKQALLIILDDETNEIPELIHSNKYMEAQLLIIWHNQNSVKESNLIEIGYSDPKGLAEFSHVSGDIIFESLLNILAGNNNEVDSFVKHWEVAAEYSVLDELSAVTQLLSLYGENGDKDAASTRFDQLLGDLSDNDFSQKIDDLYETGDVQQAIVEIEKRASQIIVEGQQLV